MLSPLRRYVFVVAGCLLICLLASTPPSFAQNTTIDSFNHAKKLLTQVYAGHETEFYCGCTVSDHRGSNSQLIDFEGVEICPIFTAKIENSEKSSA